MEDANKKIAFLEKRIAKLEKQVVEVKEMHKDVKDIQKLIELQIQKRKMMELNEKTRYIG